MRKPRIAIDLPDPSRAHGAWVQFFCSAAAGAMLGGRGGIEIPLLVGSGFAGAFLVGAALAVGLHRKARRFAGGLALTVAGPAGALLLGADPSFLVVAGATLAPALGAVWLAKRRGILSRATLLAATAAVVAVAPASALAGGASWTAAAVLFALLWPVFSWRGIRISARLEGSGSWDRAALRRSGLREAAIAAAWTVVAVFVCS
ncbi:MAG TPA: hypothetical protein ENI85_04485 [Deltaproteobacteria bacterium]|nr:hypothetical protein [Deltaproteobacteria bacterium]